MDTWASTRPTPTRFVTTVGARGGGDGRWGPCAGPREYSSPEKPPRLPRRWRCNCPDVRYHVSISNEKPPRLPPCLPAWQRSLSRCFNLKREAAPVATWLAQAGPFTLEERFNLKREAAPVATLLACLAALIVSLFQSQTRSRPGCHAAVS